jgi:hypothetical protein
MLYVNLINTEIDMYLLLPEEIRTVAKNLNPNQRLVLDYVPSSDKPNNTEPS